MVTYKPRYKWVDIYREVLLQISGIDIKFDDLLSDRAKLLINMVKEENDTEVIIVYINTIMGQFKTMQPLKNREYVQSARHAEWGRKAGGQIVLVMC